MSVQIKIIDLVGEHCHSIDDGDKFFQSVFQELKIGKKVELDFSGVESILTPFLNKGFGNLLDYFDMETIRNQLALCHISPEHLKKINEFIDVVDKRKTKILENETLRDLFGEDELGDAEL